jgi:hypothetical protein
MEGPGSLATLAISSAILIRSKPNWYIRTKKVLAVLDKPSASGKSGRNAMPREN